MEAGNILLILLTVRETVQACSALRVELKDLESMLIFATQSPLGYQHGYQWVSGFILGWYWLEY